MKKLYYLLILIFSFSVLSAQEKLSKEEKARREKNIQAGNPFVKYGCRAPVATLSKGKYLEVQDLDSIVTIGTMRWHVDNKQIVGHIVQDTLNPDAQPIGDAPGMWMSPDPLSEEFPSYSPYNFCFGNPLTFKDKDGRAPESIIINNNTGEATYVNDGINKVFVTNQTGYDVVGAYKGFAEGSGNMQKADAYLGLIQKGGYELSLDSNIGKIARTTYAEMSGLGTTNTDRQVVAESIVNRHEDGKSYSDILVSKTYNAISRAEFKDCFGSVDKLRTDSNYFYKANEAAITGNLANSFSAAFKAVNNIGTQISGNPIAYVSKPRSPTYFDGKQFDATRKLVNITPQIEGLKGIIGVWTAKK